VRILKYILGLLLLWSTILSSKADTVDVTATPYTPIVINYVYPQGDSAYVITDTVFVEYGKKNDFILLVRDWVKKDTCRKMFEYSNHLGNVLTVVSDLKIPHSTDGTTIDYYQADVLSATDYYVFHGAMPGRNFNSNDYRYGGTNGQEQDDEVFEGAYTAEYWEYDSRTGRRWNIDPVVKPWESPYACFGGNPVFYVDQNGDDWFMNDQGFYIESDEAIGGFSTYVGTSLIGVTDHYKIIERVKGKYYHKNTSNVFASIGNYFGANLVEKKEYDHAEESLNEEIRGLAYGLAGGVVLGKIGSIAKSAIAKRTIEQMSKKLCFVENTKISTKDGYKNIQDLKIGDHVYAYNVATDSVGLYRVVTLYKNEINKLVKIVTNKSVIYSTPDHLFFSSNTWVKAIDLKSNSKLLTNVKQDVLVSSISIIDTSTINVYNFEVEFAHNYYITNENILVHNDCGLTWMSAAYKNGKHIVNSYANKWTKNLAWKDIVKGTGGKKPTALYKGTEAEVLALETKALQEGVKIPLDKGVEYYVYKAETTIGATEGMETNWLRVEITSNGFFHGHPITPTDASKYLKKVTEAAAKTETK
jgi:Pretoxin HINT domain